MSERENRERRAKGVREGYKREETGGDGNEMEGKGRGEKGREVKGP